MSQSLSSLLIHIVFSTKNREPWIDSNIEPELYAFLVSISANHRSYVHKIGGIEDHIHMLVSLHKTLSLSLLIEDLKKNSSRWIKSKGKKYQSFLWQRGYGAFSACLTHMDPLIQYINDQKNHHRTVSFQDEYRHLLNKNQIAFDERYVWD